MIEEKGLSVIMIVLLIALFFCLIYVMYQFFSLLKQQDVLKKAWEMSIQVLDAQKQTRSNGERQATALYGEMEQKTMIGKLDASLAYSGFYTRFPKLTAEYVVAIVLLAVSAEGIIIWFFSKNIMWMLCGAFITIAVLYQVLQTMRLMRNRRINDELVHFLDLAEMASLTKKDVIDILRHSALKVKEPLRTELLLAVMEAEHSGNTSQALRRLINRIENKYLKDLLLNMDICSKFKANYGDVLKATKKIFIQDVGNRELLRKTYQNGLSIIVVMIIVGLCIMQLFGLIVQVDNVFLALWSGGVFGQLVVSYLVLTSAYSIWVTAVKALF